MLSWTTLDLAFSPSLADWHADFLWRWMLWPMMNIVSIFLITDINFLFSGFWGKMNDGSYRAVSTITREQAPKELKKPHLNTVGIPASFSGKKGFIVKSEFLVAIILLKWKAKELKHYWHKTVFGKKICVRSDKMLSCPEAGVLTSQMIVTFA